MAVQLREAEPEGPRARTSAARLPLTPKGTMARRRRRLEADSSPGTASPSAKPCCPKGSRVRAALWNLRARRFEPSRLWAGRSGSASLPAAAARAAAANTPVIAHNRPRSGQGGVRQPPAAAFRKAAAKRLARPHSDGERARRRTITGVMSRRERSRRSERRT